MLKLKSHAQELLRPGLVVSSAHSPPPHRKRHSPDSQSLPASPSNSVVCFSERGVYSVGDIPDPSFPSAPFLCHQHVLYWLTITVSNGPWPGTLICNSCILIISHTYIIPFNFFFFFGLKNSFRVIFPYNVFRFHQVSLDSMKYTLKAKIKLQLFICNV